MLHVDYIPDCLTDGYRGLLLICRNKDGGQGNAQRRAFTRISRCTQEFKDICEELSDLRKNKFPDYRIYSSINARDPKKVMREFKRRQLDHDYEPVEKAFDFYCDVKKRMFSCFMNPQSRSQSRFLIDCDSKEEVQYACKTLEERTVILFHYPTRNGYHFITEPFNPKGFEGEIKRDDLMYLD